MAQGRERGIAEEGELFRTHIGGSALTEGIMMRGRLNWAVAVRTPDGGIYTEEHDLPNPETRAAWKRWPLVRGCVSFVESMVLSAKAMGIAAEHAYDAGGESYATRKASVEVAGAECVQSDATGAPANAAVDAESHDGTQGSSGKPLEDVPEDSSEGLPPALMAGSMAIGFLLGVALFVAIPVAVANLVVGDYSVDNAVVWNLVEAALRILIFVAYIWGVGRMPEMARVFGYHGAEHQTIHCFEHGLPLTPANAASFSRLHVRCGTAFLIMTVIVAILVNTLVPVAVAADSLGLSGWGRMLFVFASRLVMLPLVAGVSYEVTVKWAGSHPENPVVRVVLWPGLQMQRLTTNVPDEGMLECAIAATELVRNRELAAGLEEGLGTDACCG